MSSLIFICFSLPFFQPSLPYTRDKMDTSLWNSKPCAPLEKYHSTLGRQQNPPDLPVILHHCLLDHRLRDPWVEDLFWVRSKTTQFMGLPVPRGCSSSLVPLSYSLSLTGPGSPPRGSAATFSHCVSALKLSDLEFLLHG